MKNIACTSETDPVQINIHVVVNGRHTKKADMTGVLQSYLKIIFFGHRAKSDEMCVIVYVHVCACKCVCVCVYVHISDTV